MEHIEDPVKQAWTIFGKPKLSYNTKNNVCSRCGKLTETYELFNVISRNYTDWETLNPQHLNICAPCAFSFTLEHIITRPFYVSTGRAFFPTRKEIITLLSKPLKMNEMLTLPVSRKKHIFPKSKYGYIVSDDGLYIWGDEEANLFKALTKMRNLGVKEESLKSLTPESEFIKNNIQDYAEIMQTWELFNRWNSSPIFDIAVIASRQPVEEEEE